jgi:hypothetical protein
LFVKVLASMPTSAALLHYREDFEAVIAALPADQIDQAQLEDARGLIADAIARTRPSVATQFLLNVLAVILFAAAMLLWLAALLGMWLFASLLVG